VIGYQLVFKLVWCVESRWLRQSWGTTTGAVRSEWGGCGKRQYDVRAAVVRMYGARYGGRRRCGCVGERENGVEGARLEVGYGKE
jgi:hypothetical protein